MPSTPSAAPAEAHPIASSSSTSTAAPDQRSPINPGSEPLNSDAVHSFNADPSSSDGMRRSEPGPAQPKHCARCGQLLDAIPPSSNDHQPGLARTSSSTSISAPSPSSYAFAPDSIRSQHRLQPHQSLTSAINAAAVVALSRILGNDESIPTDADGHAVCTQCAAQLADPAAPSSASTHPIDTQHPQNNAASNAVANTTPYNDAAAAAASHATFSPNASRNLSAVAPSTDAPQTHLTISVDNMGAGGDAAMTQSAEDVHMQDPSSFPPLERAPITPALGAPSSPNGVARSTSRGRIRFADAPSSHAAVPGHSHNADDRGRMAEPHALSSVLGRSGSFSRSLSYHGQESVSSSATPVVVSFPPSSAATPAIETAPMLSLQSTHSFASSASSPARPSSSQTRAGSSSDGRATATSQTHVPVTASANPGGVKQRRPSSARRTGSSTGPTTLPFAAAGTSAVTPRSPAALSKYDDPFGPDAVTRPRLGQLSARSIADELYSSAIRTRPASLISGSTSTSLAASSAQQSAGIDPTRSVRYHLDPLSYTDGAFPPFVAAGEAGDKKRQGDAVEMDVDDDKVSHGLAAKWGDVRWFDPYKPDPLAELSRLRNPPKGRGCLYPGATFNGTQKSGRNSYDVTVRVVNVDLEASHLCGYLNIRGLTEDWPELTTYFDAEIIGDRYGFVTGKWGATEADDLKHWARFAPFRPLRSALSKPGLRFNHLNKPFVFMRWKEKFLVPDHRVRDINGASFAGFYYVCVELGESAGRPPAAGAGQEARGRSNSSVSMTSGTTGRGSRSNASSPILSHPSTASANAFAAGSSSTLTGPSVSGQQWYAARTQRRRELSLSAPSYPQASNTALQPSQSTQHYYHPIYHPHSPHSPSGPGFWPASPTSPQMPISSGASGGAAEDPFAAMWGDHDDSEDGYDDLGAMGKMSGFYFHENSEPYQQLSLHHTPEACSSSFEMR